MNEILKKVDPHETSILSEVAKYYSEKLALHGQTPNGVDWNGVEGQFLRFKQLSKLIESSSSFSINDLGCGYGALYDFLSAQYKNFTYAGIDVSESMIQAAQERHKMSEQAQFYVSNSPNHIADYGVASGLFNVRLNRTDEEWFSYLENTLDILDRTSRLGFAFNCLTSYSDKDKMRDYLYYSDPCQLFDVCKRRYSRNVAILHDYDLYEFTVLVKKSS